MTRVVVRWLFVGLIAVHGLIHLLGAAKGLGWADVNQLTAPISIIEGLAWLAAAGAVLVVAAMVAVGRPAWWWIVAAGAAVLSQLVITTAWTDARAGTAANVILVLAAVLGFASGQATRAAMRIAAQSARPARTERFGTSRRCCFSPVASPAPDRRSIRERGHRGAG